MSPRSIMKKGGSGGSHRRSGNTNRRLSFAASTTLSPQQQQPPPPQETNAYEEAISDVPKPSNEFTITDSSSSSSSCKLTPFGLCYDPSASRPVGERDETVQAMKSQRRNVSIGDSTSTQSRITANVLIAGEKILSEKLKRYILDMHHQQNSVRSQNWRIDLNVTCEKTFTPKMGQKFDLIFYFLMMETHESIGELSKLIRSYSDDILPAKKIILLTVLSSEGFYKNVVDLVQFESILTSHHLVHIPLKEQGRFSYIWMKRILEFIYKSVGYHRGSSLLMDYVMHVTMNMYEGINAQD